MVRILTRAALCAAAPIAALVVATPPAQADVADSAQPPPVPAGVADPAPPPPTPPDVADPAPPQPTANVADSASAPPNGVPHLSSPENLPPGTTDTPPGPQGHGLSYLRELWNALKSQDISGKDAAILLFTQRPLDPNATPPPGLSAGPQQSPPPPADSQQLPN